MELNRLRELSGIENLTESGNIDNVVKDIQEYTSSNNHIEARILGAQFLKDKRLEKIFTALQVIYDDKMAAPHELTALEQHYYKQLMYAAEKKLSKEDYKKFYGAF